jgi:hypothetical protein
MECRQKLAQQFEPLAIQLNRHQRDPGGIAARPGEALRYPGLNRVAADYVNHGHRPGTAYHDPRPGTVRQQNIYGDAQQLIG